MYYETNDHLAHYGVKGMKWGVRRDRTPTTDVTQVSKRKLKKQIKTVNKNKSAKNVDAVNRKLVKKLNSTKEAKEWDNTVKFWAAMDEQARRQGSRLVMDRSQVDHFNAKQKAYSDKGKELYQKHRDEYASAALKDLGYDDTQAGREYIKKLDLI